MTDLIRRSVLIDEICRSSIYKWSVEEDQAAHNWALNIINSQHAVVIPCDAEVVSAEAVHGEDNEIIKAIHTINNFLDTQGVFLATSMWRAKDGTILSCDWGYFDEGMREIEKYLKGGAE